MASRLIGKGQGNASNVDAAANLTAMPASNMIGTLVGEPIIRDCWYVAGWAGEIKPGELIRRILLGTPIVLWRDLSGIAHAMEDRCPHRQAPLSLGRVEEGGLRCMYHGLMFDGGGRCVSMPSERSVPALATTAVPLVERYSLLWFWGGNPHDANPETIPDAHWLDDPAWVAAPGYIHYDTPQQLIIDNLLDFSHLSFVHATTLGGSMDWAKTLPRVRRHSGGVNVAFLFKNQQVPPYMRDIASYQGLIDRWLNYDWLIDGNILRIDTGIAPAGTVSEEVKPLDALHHHSVQALTPETATTTHYFWSVARDYALDDENITELHHQQVVGAFDEDKTMIEAQAHNIEQFGRFVTGAIPADLALLHVRKLMRQRASPTVNALGAN